MGYTIHKLCINLMSSCPTGIAHTYMAAEGVEKAARAKNISVKIETRGSAGAKNTLTAQVDAAFRKELEKSSSIINTDNLLNTSRCTLSFVFGAAIKKIKVTGSPSKASKSTPSFTTSAASPGLFTAAHFP